MARRKQVNVLSLAKLHGIAFAVIGLILGIIYGIGGAMLDALVSLGWITSSETPGLSEGTVLALFAVPMMPAMASIIGVAVGALVGVTYNLGAPIIKKLGIDVELKLTQK